jgi:hypothetical protein
MKLIVSLLLICLFFGCKTRTTPHRVEKFLPGEYWKISSFFENGVDINLDFTAYQFGFDEGGTASAKISGQFNPINGAWSTGTDKNPAILYLNFPLTTPIDTNLIKITDDWLVTSITKTEIKLTRNSGGQSASNLTLIR